MKWVVCIMKSKGNLLLTIVALTMVLVVACGWNSTALALAHAKGGKITISAINNINAVVKQNQPYNLPKTVRVVMSNKIVKNVPISWNVKESDTNRVGIKIYLGSVKGYKNKVKLSLKVIATIVSVENQNITIQHNEKFKLPKLVNAEMSNGEAKLVDVSWDRLVDTSKTGTFDYIGSVIGYSSKVKFTLNIVPVIVSVSDINITINTNSDFELPTLVEAIMSDNSSSEIKVEWKQSAIDSIHSGAYVFNGNAIGYTKPIKLTLNVVNLYSNINEVNATVKINEKYTLPQTVTATMKNGITTAAAIIWDKTIVDTGKAGSIIIEGTVIGYDKKIKAVTNVVATIISIPDKKVEMRVGDEYNLPKTLTANMSDGSLQDVAVTWNPQPLDFKKIGIIDVTGTVNGYSSNIHLYITIKSDFTCTSKSATYTNYQYILISFNKNIKACTNLNKIVLTDENGVRISITKGAPGATAKTCLLLYPAHSLTKNMKYTLIIPKDTIQSEAGEFNSEEIKLEMKN
jgi:uncharacterized protein involved in tolerance to divalent cations